MTEPIRTPLEPSFIRRVSEGFRYAVQGVTPTGWFSPSQPIAPVAQEEAKGRAWDYMSGYNIQISPRAGEPVGFNTLRNLADGYDLLRLVIETRKDQLERLPWTIVFRDEKKTDDANDPRIKEVRQRLMRPDGRLTWRQWSRMVLEDMLVLDAPTVYVRRTNGGGLFALEPLDGSTIAPKIDDSGRVPLEGVAYQQIIKGVPACDYTTEELIYYPRNLRTNKVYGYCYDDQTEILTKDNGWVKFDELSGSDVVATRSKDGEFEWQAPSRIVKEDWDGDMCHFHSRSVDILVTPEHRMLINSLPKALGGKKSRPKGDAIVSAEDLFQHHNRETKIPMVSSWSGREVGDKVFGEDVIGNMITVTRNNKDGTTTEFDRRSNTPVVRHISGDDFCALMGAYLSEGNIRKKGGIEVSQLEKSKGYPAYRELFDRLGGGYTGRAFVLPWRALTDYFRQFGHAHEKFIPSEIREASPRQLKIFWDHYVLGDGHFEKRTNLSGRGNQPTNGDRITTVSRRMADQLVEIAQKLGWSASVRKRSGGTAMIVGNECKTRDSYVINVRYSKAMNFQSEKVHYTGRIYCVTVPNGIVYVRRNGKPAWCGNSPVEQVITTVNIALRRQIAQLGYYTEGNLPETLISVPKEWSVDQIKQFDEHFNSVLEGKAAFKRRGHFVPDGTKPYQIKDSPLKDDMDDWLARIVCYAFSVSPQGLIQMQNRATAQVGASEAAKEGLEPLKLWMADFVNECILKGWGYDDIEFKWQEEEAVDPLIQAQVNQIYINAKVLTPNEVRADLGRDPIDGGDEMAQAQAKVPSGEDAKGDSNKEVGKSADAPFGLRKFLPDTEQHDADGTQDADPSAAVRDNEDDDRNEIAVALLGLLIPWRKKVWLELGRTGNPPVDDGSGAWAIDYARKTVNYINATTARKIKEAVDAAHQDPSSTMDDVSAKIRDVFNEARKSRSNIISETMSTAVFGMASLKAMISAGVEEADWITERDGRVRPTHSVMDGQRQKVGGFFLSPSGDMAQFPGGFATAAENVNCRCHLRPVIMIKSDVSNDDFWHARDAIRAKGAERLARVIRRIFARQKKAVMAALNKD